MHWPTTEETEICAALVSEAVIALMTSADS